MRLTKYLRYQSSRNAVRAFCDLALPPPHAAHPFSHRCEIVCATHGVGGGTARVPRAVRLRLRTRKSLNVHVHLERCPVPLTAPRGLARRHAQPPELHQLC